MDGRAHRPRLFGIVLVAALMYGWAAQARPVESDRGNCRVLRCMARMYMACGDYEKAEKLGEMALSRARQQQAGDEQLALCLIDLATLYNRQDKTTHAEKLCMEGLEHQKQALGVDHPYVAYTLRMLSSIYRKQGRYTQAGETLDQAREIMLSTYAPGDGQMVGFEVERARLLVAEGKTAEAVECYEKAIVAVKRSYGPGHLYTAGRLRDMAELYLQQGRLAEAEEHITEALEIEQRIYGRPEFAAIRHQSGHLAATLLVRAKICRARRDFSAAEKSLARAMRAATGDFQQQAQIYHLARQIRNRESEKAHTHNLAD